MRMQELYIAKLVALTDEFPRGEEPRVDRVTPFELRVLKTMSRIRRIVMLVGGF
jgi:hypothetical protein